MTQGNTLKELDVRPGDVVRSFVTGEEYTFSPTWAPMGDALSEPRWEIVSRATPDAPTLWRDMTPEQKGALLLAHHEGKVIETWGGNGWWFPCVLWVDDYCYRAAPPTPTRVTVDLFAGTTDQTIARIGTIEYQDGKPDPSSIKMEALP